MFAVVVQVANGSQWEVAEEDFDTLIWSIQTILGPDLMREEYYLREATVDGVFSSELMFDVQARLRA
jgi:hypothetical protein